MSRTQHDFCIASGLGTLSNLDDSILEGLTVNGARTLADAVAMAIDQVYRLALSDGPDTNAQICAVDELIDKQFFEELAAVRQAQELSTK